jgi:uncharacterized protein (DUF362 family)
MGIIYDRPSWHIRGLSQCIADLATRVRPHLTILDATRLLTTNGPKGPGKVKVRDQIIASADPLAVDAYGATLFGVKAGEIAHLTLAAQQKVGEIDLKRVRIVKV